MARKPEKTRASWTGLARGLDERRLRRNAGKQALARTVLGEGLELDERSRLTATSGQGSSRVATSFSDLSPLRDDLQTEASDVVVGGVTDPADSPASVDDLRDDLVDNVLPDIKENLATLTKRVNEILERLKNGS